MVAISSFPHEPKRASCSWGDRAPLEKDKVRVVLLFELLKPGVIIAEEHFYLRSGADTSRSRGNFFGVCSGTYLYEYTGFCVLGLL
jgi:hypothetical protein